MDIRNCAKCGKIFTYTGKPVCPQCIKEDEDTFETLKKYIEDYPLSSINEISEATSVSQKRILKYVKEGRLIFAKAAGLVTCESCGEPVVSGKYCEKCKAQLAKKFSETIESKKADEPQPDRSSKAKMHITSGRTK